LNQIRVGLSAIRFAVELIERGLGATGRDGEDGAASQVDIVDETGTDPTYLGCPVEVSVAALDQAISGGRIVGSDIAAGQRESV
jgi:hypothetical protein